jgi:hypothetical protein
MLLRLGACLLTTLAGAAPVPLVSTQTTWFGMCDASAAVALSTNLFVVGNDEDNALRVFALDRPGLPVQSIELSSFLDVDPRKPESDLEAATWLGDTIFWITSHGQNRSGKFRTSRHRLFATRAVSTAKGIRLVPIGTPYTRLLLDLVAEPRLRPFKLAATLHLPPKAPGAINIEGLCAAPGTNLLIGFRNPIPGGKALVVPLLNPFEILAGRRARLGDPILLDLDGRGIRDFTCWQGRYFIMAGSYDARGHQHFYMWEGGKATPQKLEGTHLKGINPEAVVTYPDRSDAFQLLSDDGTDQINGVPCKSLPDPALRRFRSVWIQPDLPQ